jgi:hypothetical protein
MRAFNTAAQNGDYDGVLVLRSRRQHVLAGEYLTNTLLLTPVALMWVRPLW